VSTSVGQKGGPEEPGTHLVIPYYVGDLGRPLPSSYPFWMCPSILVNGSPYTGQALKGGQTVELSLIAVNHGFLTAPGVCVFFWANPTTSFTDAAVNVIGVSTVALPRDALTTTPIAVAWTIPEGIPEHVCLLAEITTPADPAESVPGHPGTLTYDAATDRHFGQQNIHVVTVAPGGKVRVGFVVANGMATAGRFRLEVTHLLVNHQALRHVVSADAPLRKAEAISVRAREHTSDLPERPDGLDLGLDGGQQIDVELTAQVPADASPGTVIILQLAQYEHQSHQPLGGLGVVVHVA
jgi:hypothetical protein